MKTKLKKIKSVKAGIELPAWLHLIFGKTAKMSGLLMKEAHMEASVEWLKKTMAINPAIMAFVETEAQKDADMKAALFGGPRIVEKR